MDRADAKKLIGRRHVEWREHESTWRWLQDSYEGGDRYRDEAYGMELYSASWDALDPLALAHAAASQSQRQFPRRNLIRHKHEYPAMDVPYASAGIGDAYYPPTDDEYELRRARTPVPTFVAEAVEAHLSKIYGDEVKREGPDDLTAWWADVDGKGTAMDDWMAETVAPLLLVLGQLDLAFDHPRAPAGASVQSQADVTRLGLSRCLAAYILPENLLWWRPDLSGRYAECLVREYAEDEDGRLACRYRHWTAADSTLYDAEAHVIDRTEHPYGRVPIRRVFDVKKPRCDHVGRSRYHRIAELQREYYNVESELILSCTLQAHPLPSGPEDFAREGTVAIGPGRMLPKKRNDSGASVTYEGWEYVTPPSEPADKLRQRLLDLRDAVDRAACLTKPAGATGTGASTVSQSGVSKTIDQSTGNDLLSKLAKVLKRAEMQMAELALTVLRHKAPDPALLDTVTITYPTRYELQTASELAAQTADFQANVAAAGDLPETEGELLKAQVRLMLRGRDDAEYDQLDTEIDVHLAGKAEHSAQMAELGARAAASLPLGGPQPPQSPPDQANPDALAAGDYAAA